MQTVHPDLIGLSARDYLAHLQTSDSSLTPNGQSTAQALANTMRAVLELGPALEAADVQCTWRQLAAAELEDADLIINDWQLGYGHDGAPVISIGTEHAYELEPEIPKKGPRYNVGLAELTYECLVAAIWASGSKPAVMNRISGAPWWAPPHFTAERPYHIYTADYYKPAPRATWPTIGRDLLHGGGDWRTVLGERCYQIELSGYPAFQSVGGREPSKGRLEFLREVLGTMAATAKVVLFHGSPKWSVNDPREALAASFLDLPALGSPTGAGDDSYGHAWRVHDAHDRRVIFCRALSGLNVTGEYLSQLSQLISEVAPEAIAGGR